VSCGHDVNKYVDLLANDGTIVLVGLVSKPLVLNYTSLAGPPSRVYTYGHPLLSST